MDTGDLSEVTEMFWIQTMLMAAQTCKCTKKIRIVTMAYLNEFYGMQN